nr:ParB N-terminal domain-containing protein [Paenibacillus tianmuensis]
MHNCSTGGTGKSAPKIIKGTSYDINKLYKSQPSNNTHETGINDLIEVIQEKGPEAVPPIPVYVHSSQAIIVDGHHRLEAFRRLGYERVPIKYIHKNQIEKLHYRTLEDVLAGMHK